MWEQTGQAELKPSCLFGKVVWQKCTGHTPIYHCTAYFHWPHPLLQEFNKVYENDEIELSRLTIWTTHRKFVEEHNANADLWGFTTGMNEYADLVSQQGGGANC